MLGFLLLLGVSVLTDPKRNNNLVSEHIIASVIEEFRSHYANAYVAIEQQLSHSRMPPCYSNKIGLL